MVRTVVIAVSCALILTGCGGNEPVDIASEAPRTDEPGAARIHVDNSGENIRISVRSSDLNPSTPIDLAVNDKRIPVVAAPGRCATSPPGDNLLWRVTIPRDCVPKPANLSVRLQVGDQEPVLARAKRSERPNVLLFMVDDMRVDEMKFMPRVQELIGDAGVTFRNGFSPYPLCCPARASVLTGDYTHNHQVWSHEDQWGFNALRDDATLPVWLQRAGYYTTYLGKYLNQYGGQPPPGQTSGTSTQYCPPGWDLWRASIDGGLERDHPNQGGTYRFFRTTVNDNCDGYLTLDDYQTRAYADLTTEMLDEAPEDQPFFSYVSFTAPHNGGPRENDDPADLGTPARPDDVKGIFDHVITEAPGADWELADKSKLPKALQREELSDDMLDQIRNLARQRAESLYVVDEAIADILNHLKQDGKLANTVVLFTSDNGYLLGEHDFRATKLWAYEDSLRVPLLIRGPGIPAGEERTDPFLSIDFAPTLADLAEVRHRLTDGVSLLDVARLGDDSTDDTFRRLVLTETRPPSGAGMAGRITGIRTASYLFIQWWPEPSDPAPGILTELYNLRDDPNESNNLAAEAEYADIVAGFQTLLEGTRGCAGAECHVPVPVELR